MGVKTVLLRVKADGTKVYGLRINARGVRKTISIGSKAAAERARPQAEIMIASGKLDQKPREKTLGEVSRAWLEFIAASRAPRTHDRYRAILDRHIDILDKPIAQVTRGDIRDTLLRYRDKGVSKASVEMAHSVLSGIFLYALDDGLVTATPTTKVMRRLDIANDRKDIQPFSAAEMDDILRVIDPDYRPFFFASYHTGARMGELLALEWADIDFDRKTISITKTAKDQEIRHSTKTDQNRTIDISDTLLEMFKGMRAVDKKGRYVFHKGGKLLAGQTLLRRIGQACATLGIPRRTIHDIRHTTASILLARGVPVTYVAKMLGHSSTRMTLDRYSHYLPSENRGMINALDE
jgi:integrase